MHGKPALHAAVSASSMGLHKHAPICAELHSTAGNGWRKFARSAWSADPERGEARNQALSRVCRVLALQLMPGCSGG